MKDYSLLRTIISSVIGLVIGVIFTALVKLIIPAANFTRALFPICLAANLFGVRGVSRGRQAEKSRVAAVRYFPSRMAGFSINQIQRP